MFISHAKNNERNIRMTKIKMLSPKIDLVFQRLFGEVGNEKITKRFIEKVLDEKIDQLDLSKNPILRREKRGGKLGILDVLVEVNGKEKVNIEMQVVKKQDIKERILYYWSRLYIKGIKEGEEYQKLDRTIIILITDFLINGLEELEYHTEWKIIEEKGRKIILTDKLEIHIIELEKIKGKEKEEGELLDWLFFIDNPESERVKVAMKENEELKEANEKLSQMSEEEELQRFAEWREKAIRDEASSRASGLQEGKEQGKIEKTKEIAKKMLKEKLEISLIGKLTGLSEEEIRKLED